MVCEFYLNKTVTYETKHTEDYMLPNIFGALFSTEQHICAVFLLSIHIAKFLSRKLYPLTLSQALCESVCGLHLMEGETALFKTTHKFAESQGSHLTSPTPGPVSSLQSRLPLAHTSISSPPGLCISCLLQALEALVFQ